MTQKKNSYKRRRRKKSILNGITTVQNTKGKLGASSLETAKDLVVGVIGGGAAGAAIGKPSLLVGLAVTGLGHYAKNRMATSFGIGMMAANGFQNNTVSGTTEGLEGAKERVMRFKDAFTEKLYLDKIPMLKKKGDGMGEVDYFVYPGDEDIDLSELDQLEDQVAQSAIEYRGDSPEEMVSGHDIGGAEDIGYLHDDEDDSFYPDEEIY